jgi:hypothetical protein
MHLHTWPNNAQLYIHGIQLQSVWSSWQVSAHFYGVAHGQHSPICVEPLLAESVAKAAALVHGVGDQVHLATACDKKTKHWTDLMQHERQDHHQQR